MNIQNKTLLITGGTGSFGHAVMARYLNSDQFKEIRIFSRDEKKQDDMRRKYNNSKIKFYLGDVRDLASVESVVKGVDFIFHAAALKQVPSCEFFPMEAVKTNVLGTENVLYAAEKYEVSKVVVLSTDKAVYPINAMGMSKALMEKVTLARSRNLDDRKSIFCITRYGNVMASRGSVIPMFIEQIKSGKPITLTDAGMTRFMMTLEEAVELVEYAFDHGRQGDLFVRKAPGATIETLALALQELYKVRNEVRTIGTRHGEKMFETLVNREEMLKAEEMEDYYRIPANTRDLNYEQYFSEGYTFNNSLEEYHSKNTKRLDLEEMKSLLMQLPTIREDIFGEKNVIHDSE
ncbi:MAG TPA: polysaccharide biosynthesis protein [Niabella sp.]|nr:polysaccharide biosynthesis protein [Niabella sp.]HOZ97369.1 polysaccharide biosynthesis protein [Niabella sp.]HQW15360.1 polysaccharide biosynthesis protein [Niabella sp.]HQX20594.1 polysaccharide biosynthesis protein [Niabella sp.]HQX40979.1 polysaccharide biosynthesis protein [Niabella sp.]